MKLDNQCVVWINCRTKQEQEEVLDIFEGIGATWSSGKHPRQVKACIAPMHFLLEYGDIRHGDDIVDGTEDYVKDLGGVVSEAKDFHNQCISIRRRR